MNKNDFSELANQKDPINNSEEAAMVVITNVFNLFTDFADTAHVEHPNTIDSVSAGSSQSSAMLTLSKESLRYDFVSNDNIINVYFVGDIVDFYTFDGTNMISDKFKHPFELSDVEHELDNFKS